MYILYDCYGAPQCGYDMIKFETYEDFEEYLEEHEDTIERIEEGYAHIVDQRTQPRGE